jgi:nucleotide-binding universal stress UspA family protein
VSPIVRSSSRTPRRRHPAASPRPGVCDRLKERKGITPAPIDWRQERDSSAANAVSETAADYDLLVAGESEPSLTERVLGDVTNRVADRLSDPLLVVRNR